MVSLEIPMEETYLLLLEIGSNPTIGYNRYMNGHASNNWNQIHTHTHMYLMCVCPPLSKTCLSLMLPLKKHYSIAQQKDGKGATISIIYHSYPFFQQDFTAFVEYDRPPSDVTLSVVTEKKSKAISATVGKGRISRRNSVGIIDINHRKCIYIYIHNIYREIMNHGYVVYRISFIRHGQICIINK